MDRSPATRAACDRADLERHLREVTFAASDDPDLVGVEVEVIPVDASNGRAVPVAPTDGGGPASGRVLGELAARSGWQETVSPAGAPAFLLPRGGQLSFEPGGQLELSSVPRRSVDALASGLEQVLREVGDAARTAGIALIARGVDPIGPLADARLHVRAERYVRMAEHFDRRGPWGRRMMRQSAAVHVNVDLGPDPLRRWRVARRAAPALVAAFANSPRAEGRETGHRSWRAAQWRWLDPTRTGLPDGGEDPVEGYLDFALGADAFLLGPAGRPAEAFHRWLERGIGMEHAEAHLSTLFPEVRPRGYLEIRCFDALPLRWCVVPAVVCAGLLYDPETLEEAADELEEPGPDALALAGRAGVRDEDVRRSALRVLDLALAGAERLPRGMVGEAVLERAVEYRDRFTARGRDPGDEGGGFFDGGATRGQP